jgi:hypothetical protein
MLSNILPTRSKINTENGLCITPPSCAAEAGHMDGLLVVLFKGMYRGLYTICSGIVNLAT